jgi:hypothetical protein
LTVSRTSFGAFKSNGQIDIGGLVKKFLIAAVAALALAAVATTASAQHRGGGGSGGGSWGGGSSHGSGSWGGGSSHGSGSWHGGGNWHGGHDGHAHFGFAVGFPFYWPYYSYGYYPYGYYPYGYGYPDYDGYSSYYGGGAPQTYIQRDTGDAIAPAGPPQRSQFSSPQRSQYSYYCTDPAGYYPQIANCPSGWLTVVPNSAPSAPAPH